MTYIDLRQLEADPRNANVCSEEMLQKLKTNIQRTGLCPPLIVRPNPEKPDYYILMDGHHRKQVLEALGWEKAPCQVWDISDHEAQIALATLNRLRGEDMPRKRAELLASLTQTLSPDALAALIPESEAQIRDLIALIQSDHDALEKSLQAEIQKEQAVLPIPYTFLISSEDKSVLDKALLDFSEGLSDRGLILIRICAKAMEALHGTP